MLSPLRAKMARELEMVLHTWDQKLGPHFDLHCVIPVGALTGDGERWISGDPNPYPSCAPTSSMQPWIAI